MVNNLIKNFILILVIFLVFSSIFSFLSKDNDQIKLVPINQLATDINQGKVKQITVSGNTVSITYADNTQGTSKKESGTDISQTLINYGAEKDKLAPDKVKIDVKEQSSILNWLVPIITFLPILILFLFFFFSLRQARTGAMQAFDFTKARARLFGAEGHPHEKINFADVAGSKEAKEELKEIVDFLKNPKKYLQMGARIPRGVLLLGPAGVGKTLLARAVAGEASVPFFHTSGSTFVELFVGVGASRVRDLFATAKKAGRAIIFIDELDAIGRIRGSGIGGGHDEREQTLNQILVEMDGFERDDTRIVMAATNRPDVLDPALLRPGRFDRKVVLDLPDINDREAILKIHCRGKPLASNVGLREVAERTPGFSGADLANVVNEAAILAARRNKHQIFQTEFLESIEKVLLGPERKSHILSKNEKEIAAFHEAGHALVSSSLPEAEPVRKVSIVARGMAAGYTLKMPAEERKLKTKTEFLAEMATLFGGYCAEKLIFKEITTGASNDLKIASELARRLVKEYGMSSLGPICFGEKEEYVFLGKEISEQRNYSEEVAAKIDKEVAHLIEISRKKAESILNQRKSLLNKIAKTLIEKETIEKEEFEKLISEKGEKNTRALKKIPKVQTLKIKEIK
jgi:cell division protease FtsH